MDGGIRECLESGTPVIVDPLTRIGRSETRAARKGRSSIAPAGLPVKTHQLQPHRSYRRLSRTKKVPRHTRRNPVRVFEFRVRMLSFVPTQLCNYVPRLHRTTQ